MWYCLFMERVPFPGLTDTRIAERKIKRILMPAISKDGVCLHFTKTFYPDNPEKRTPYIELLVREGLSIQINNRVLEDMGQGDLEAGLAVIADSLCDLDYAGLRVGDCDPVHTDVIYPFYGGQDAYLAAMDVPK
jgi:hypothetical protein